MNLYKKKICVISSSRSEIGILKNLIYQLNDDNFFLNKIIGDTINVIIRMYASQLKL